MHTQKHLSYKHFNHLFFSEIFLRLSLPKSAVIRLSRLNLLQCFIEMISLNRSYGTFILSLLHW